MCGHTPEQLADRDAVEWDAPTVTVLRSVLMKPEHYDYVPHLHAAAGRALANAGI